MARQVERRGQPQPRLDVELPAALPRQPGDRGDGRLERGGVERGAVADCPEVGEVERRRTEAGHRARRRIGSEAEEPEPGGLPEEDGSEGENPERGEEGGGAREGPRGEAAGRGCVEVEAAPWGEDLH